MEISSRYSELVIDKVPDFHNNELLRECLNDEQLLSELLINNKEFALSIIKTYIGSLAYIRDKFNIEEDDLLQLAYIGITNALQTFDFDRNIKFTTYCYRPILWEIKPYIYKDSWTVPLSRESIKLMGDMETIANNLGYFPTPEYLADSLGVDIKKVLEVIMFAGNIQSLDAESMSTTLDSVMEDPDQFETTSIDSVYIEQLVDQSGFDDREREVVALMLKDYNNSRIAEELGIYPMTVNRIQERMRLKAQDSYFDKKSTKYSEEVDIIAEACEERDEKMSIEDIAELLEVCGYDLEQYSPRVLYYIRQRALLKLEEE